MASSGSGHRRTTLRDVAERAGVSVQTASNATRGRFDLMGAETRTRVENAMRELGYRPNLTARSLREARTNALGFFVLDESSSFMADPLTALLLAGVSSVARDAGYEVLVRADRPFEVSDSLVRPLLEGRADGAVAVLSGTPDVRAQYIELLKQTRVPFVIFDEIIDEPGVLSVRTSERKSSHELTRQLLDRGHRDIGFIAARVPWALTEQRHLGYLDALREADIEPDTGIQLFEATWQSGGGRQMASKLLARPKPPTAIICSSDVLAIGALRAARDAGRRVPADLAVAGFDDFEFSEYTDPPLTTVRVPGFEMGRVAAELLLKALNGDEPESTTIVLDNELIIRESI